VFRTNTMPPSSRQKHMLAARFDIELVKIKTNRTSTLLGTKRSGQRLTQTSTNMTDALPTLGHISGTSWTWHVRFCTINFWSVNNNKLIKE
jgi:hypothetical protein